MNGFGRAGLWLAAMLLLVFVGSFAAASFAAQSVAYRDPATHMDLSVLLRMPIPVLNKVNNGWQVLGLVWLLLAALALCGSRFARSLPSGSSGLLVLGFAIVAVALMFFPITLSADVYAYVIYGRLYGLFGINPYFLPLPLNSHFDPVVTQCLTIYGNPPPGDNYGPLWTLVAGFWSKLLAHSSLKVQIVGWRLLAVIFAIITLLGIRRIGVSQTAFSRFAFHPLLLFETAVGAHNDIMMVALAVWAFAVVETMPLLAGVLIGAAIAIKYPAVCALPFLLVKARKGGWLRLSALFVIAALVVVLAFRPFWIGSLTALSLFWQSNNVVMSPTWIINNIVQLLTGGRDFGAFSVSTRYVQTIETAVFLILYVISVWRYARAGGRAMIWFAVSALLWIAPMLNPWYVLWLLPATVELGTAGSFAWTFGAAALLRYGGEVPIYPPVPLLVGLTVLIFGAPLVFARRARTLMESAPAHGQS